MSVLTSILSKIFGNKYEREIKEIEPVASKIKEEYAKLESVSNDEIRARTINVKKKILDYIKPEEDKIKELREHIETEKPAIEEVEKIYNQIDNIEKDIDKKLVDVLNEVLPEAYAIVKQTAKRFNDNEYLEATATEFDKDLAATKPHIQIEGDKVRYYNKWIAGGNEITWDMVHYDVQLIGGVVLHQGRIAEMATGEGKTLVATLPVFLNALTGRGEIEERR